MPQSVNILAHSIFYVVQGHVLFVDF